MTDPSIRRFFGGSPARVLLRLVFLSFVVGLVLTALDIHPLEIVDMARRMVERIYDMGFAAIEHLAGYFILGAIIVFPVWLIIRLTKMGKKDPM
jgi:hypothetical protein